ncbi:MAG: hypothetical protein ABEJ92_12150 [Halobacteriales archaeon]
MTTSFALLPGDIADSCVHDRRTLPPTHRYRRAAARAALSRPCRPFEFSAFVSRDDWLAATEEHMPSFGFERLDQVVGFIDRAAEQWADGEGARYLHPSTEEGGDIAETAGFSPEWDARRVGSDVGLAKGTGAGGTASSGPRLSSS